MKEARVMKDHVDKLRGIVTLMVEALVEIKPTVTFRLDEHAGHRKRNRSDSWVILRPKH